MSRTCCLTTSEVNVLVDVPQGCCQSCCVSLNAFILLYLYTICEETGSTVGEGDIILLKWMSLAQAAISECGASFNLTGQISSSQRSKSFLLSVIPVFLFFSHSHNKYRGMG